MKQLADRLLGRVVTKMGTLQKLVVDNFEALQRIREQTDDASGCADALRSLKEVETFVRETAFVGLVLTFRGWVLAALSDVLEARIPFIANVIEDLHQHVRGSRAVDSLAQSAGIRSEVDPHLLAALQQSLTSSGDPQQDLRLWSMLMVRGRGRVLQAPLLAGGLACGRAGGIPPIRVSRGVCAFTGGLAAAPAPSHSRGLTHPIHPYALALAMATAVPSAGYVFCGDSECRHDTLAFSPQH